MTTVASALWRRLDCPGHDVCWLDRDENGMTLRGTAVFRHESGPARIDYQIKCNPSWETTSGEFSGYLGDRSVSNVVTRHGSLWRLNGVVVSGFEALIDLDFGFTPATNLVQLRRVEMATGETMRLPVVWLDVGSSTLSGLVQFYRRIDENTMAYEAPSVGYKGDIKLSSNGFIRRYPGLWDAEDTADNPS